VYKSCKTSSVPKPNIFIPSYISKYMAKLKVTNTKTGKVWVEENAPHSWEGLVLDMLKVDKDIKLVWCDMECLVECPYGVGWYALDECGAWEYIPGHYTVEVIGEHNV